MSDGIYYGTLLRLFEKQVSLYAFTNTARFYHYFLNEEYRIIGMNSNLNIGFGSFNSSCSATGIDLNVVSNPFLDSTSMAEKSYLNIALELNGSVFDVTYLAVNDNLYCPELLSRLFQFSILQDVPCNLEGNKFQYFHELWFIFLQNYNFFYSSA